MSPCDTVTASTTHGDDETHRANHELTLEALRLEWPALAEINRRIVLSGGNPIPARPEFLARVQQNRIGISAAEDALGSRSRQEPNPGGQFVASLEDRGAEPSAS